MFKNKNKIVHKLKKICLVFDIKIFKSLFFYIFVLILFSIKKKCKVLGIKPYKRYIINTYFSNL
jgi:hypothetical protein